ncbi:MAG: glycosyltransferase family 4 protein [Ferruginibacter sp.]|nr:glycosyltransferase family 4 protein [Ferruginibacter sp.]
MRIVVNCWVLRNKQLDGIGNFTVETLQRMMVSHPEVEFLLLCDKNFNEPYFDFPNVIIYRKLPPYRHPALYVWYMETVVRRFLKKHRPDVFLGMEGFLSLGSSCKQLPIIYDLNFEHYPKDHTLKNRWYYRTFFKRFARKATRIATISTYSKQDIVQWYGVDADKIDNVSCGIKAKFQPLQPDVIQETRNNYTHGAPYFFFVGSMHPRKNIVRLLQAYALFRERSNEPVKLVLSGHILWDDASIQAVMRSHPYAQDVVFTGRVSDDTLKCLLGSALALTFVPTFEGFGLPIVEAFQSEVPVICSNTTSMPEVAGDAALLVDPFHPEDIAAAMQTIQQDEGLRKRLIALGSIQKQQFTWQRTADLLFQCIKKTANAQS